MIMRSYPSLAPVLIALALCFAVSRPVQASSGPDPAISSIGLAAPQTPDVPPPPAEVFVLWATALGTVGSVIMGIVKFFTSNLAKLPDWLKGLVALALPSVVAFIAHFFGYKSLPPDLLHAVPLLAAGALGMGLRALLKAFAPKLSAATAESVAG
jgi:hypothetical protein